MASGSRRSRRVVRPTPYANPAAIRLEPSDSRLTALALCDAVNPRPSGRCVRLALALRCSGFTTISDLNQGANKQRTTLLCKQSSPWHLGENVTDVSRRYSELMGISSAWLDDGLGYLNQFPMESTYQNLIKSVQSAVIGWAIARYIDAFTNVESSVISTSFTKYFPEQSHEDEMLWLVQAEPSPQWSKGQLAERAQGFVERHNMAQATMLPGYLACAAFWHQHELWQKAGLTTEGDLAERFPDEVRFAVHAVAQAIPFYRPYDGQGPGHLYFGMSSIEYSPFIDRVRECGLLRLPAFPKNYRPPAPRPPDISAANTITPTTATTDHQTI